MLAMAPCSLPQANTGGHLAVVLHRTGECLDFSLQFAPPQRRDLAARSDEDGQQ
jgi:hypothetical protein